MSNETIKFRNEYKGSGLIVKAKNENEIFINVRDLEYDSEKNYKIAFETTDGKKGLNAIGVRRV